MGFSSAAFAPAVKAGEQFLNLGGLAFGTGNPALFGLGVQNQGLELILTF